jgi:RNA 2',3'-cyclic 3'-phosphodiesterase
MKRTFFAVDIRPDEKLTEVIRDVRNLLAGEKIKWVAADAMHLTLKFLGDTPEDTIPQIIRAMEVPFGKIPVMSLQLSGIGLFKNLHNPRVIWIGIMPCPSLEQAFQILGNTLVSFGYPAEPVEFVPHLTLGRIREIKESEKLARLVEKYKNNSFGTATIREIIYYESILNPEGPEYHPLARFPLPG